MKTDIQTFGHYLASTNKLLQILCKGANQCLIVQIQIQTQLQMQIQI